jgi:hypothetical protein
MAAAVIMMPIMGYSYKASAVIAGSSNPPAVRASWQGSPPEGAGGLSLSDGEALTPSEFEGRVAVRSGGHPSTSYASGAQL